MEPLITNRFPIFAAWCYLIARRLGYSEDEAKSLAVTRAKLGAAARAGLLGQRGHRSRPAGGAGEGRGQDRSDARGRAPEEIDQIPFVEMRPFVTDAEGERRGVLNGGEGPRVVPPRQYDTSVERKLGDAYPAVLRALEPLAEALPPDELNHRGYELWEQFAPMVRDAQGRESRPRFGQRGVFDPAKVKRLVAQTAQESRKAA
jgi:hypothetical protein